MSDERKDFSYTYSAEEQAELKKIRDKYVQKEESKFERLVRLDKKVTEKATVVSLILGIVGILVLGFGMSLCMSNLSSILGSNEDKAIIIGVIIGVFGGIIAGIAYPVYRFVEKNEKERLAPEIIRLTDELMK